MGEEDEQQFNKFAIRRAVSKALRDAYMKHLEGWEAKIFSGNFDDFIENKVIEYLEEDE